MVTFDLLWWLGFVAVSAIVLAPLALLPALLSGTQPGTQLFLTALITLFLAPWISLLVLSFVHRLLPSPPQGKHRMFSDRGAIQWALRSWAPGLYLTLFQPVFFLSSTFGRLALRAFGARIDATSWVTSRTIIREPHAITIGARSVVGEYAHLVTSVQPSPKLLITGDIFIGQDTLIGAYSRLGPGVKIGDRTLIEHSVDISLDVQIGSDCRIGGGTAIYAGARIGDHCRIGKRSFIPAGAVLPAGTRLDDETTWKEAT